MGGLTTDDDVGVGDRADRTALTELMSAMRLKVPVLEMSSFACQRWGCLRGFDDAGVGKKADRTASTELMSAMRLKLPAMSVTLPATRPKSATPNQGLQTSTSSEPPQRSSLTSAPLMQYGQPCLQHPRRKCHRDNLIATKRNRQHWHLQPHCRH